MQLLNILSVIFIASSVTVALTTAEKEERLKTLCDQRIAQCKSTCNTPTPVSKIVVFNLGFLTIFNRSYNCFTNYIFLHFYHVQILYNNTLIRYYAD